MLAITTVTQNQYIYIYIHTYIYIYLFIYIYICKIVTTVRVQRFIVISGFQQAISLTPINKTIVKHSLYTTLITYHLKQLSATCFGFF